MRTGRSNRVLRCPAAAGKGGLLGPRNVLVRLWARAAASVVMPLRGRWMRARQAVLALLASWLLSMASPHLSYSVRIAGGVGPAGVNVAVLRVQCRVCETAAAPLWLVPLGRADGAQAHRRARTSAVLGSATAIPRR